jgi:uncharacterized phiE125 gp8 family phage protein
LTLSLQHRVELVTAPANEPVSLSEVKSHLRVEHNDEDALIARLIGAAIDYIDVTGALGQGMITQTWGEWFGANLGTVRLSLGPIQSVTAIKYYDTNNALQTATLSDFFILGRPGHTTLKPKSGFNWPVAFARDDAIKVEYVIGYGTTPGSIPQTVRHGLMMLVGHWYENRENELIGTISKTLPHGFSALMDNVRGNWYG